MVTTKACPLEGQPSRRCASTNDTVAKGSFVLSTTSGSWDSRLASYQVWDPKGCGPEEGEELSSVRTMLLNVSRWLGHAGGEGMATALLLDSETFFTHASDPPVQRAAVDRKHDLIFNLRGENKFPRKDSASKSVLGLLSRFQTPSLFLKGGMLVTLAFLPRV